MDIFQRRMFSFLGSDFFFDVRWLLEPRVRSRVSWTSGCNQGLGAHRHGHRWSRTWYRLKEHFARFRKPCRSPQSMRVALACGRRRLISPISTRESRVHWDHRDVTTSPETRGMFKKSTWVTNMGRVPSYATPKPRRKCTKTQRCGEPQIFPPD